MLKRLHTVSTTHNFAHPSSAFSTTSSGKKVSVWMDHKPIRIYVTFRERRPQRASTTFITMGTNYNFAIYGNIFGQNCVLIRTIKISAKP